MADFPNLPRHGSTATVLDGPQCRAAPVPDHCGKVLAAGGSTNAAGVTATAELYDPLTGTWAPTGPMLEPRARHTATLLSDGTVLVTGGSVDFCFTATATAEVYDPATGSWRSAGTMTNPRCGHTATLLDGPDCRRAVPIRPPYCGKVLVAGGRVNNSAELYDPGTPDAGVGVRGTWAPTTPITFARYEHTATLLDGPACRLQSLPSPGYCGKVLVVGVPLPDGVSNGAELYDPALGNWSLAAPPRDRARHVAALIDGPECTGTPFPAHCGKVLVAGGGNDATTRKSAQLYDPVASTTVNGVTLPGSWTDTGSMSTSRYYFAASLVDGPSCRATVRPSYCGNVLVVGGAEDFPPLPTVPAELFDPGADEGRGRWRSAGAPLRSRGTLTTTLLAGPRCEVQRGMCGRVLALGGDGDFGSAELFDPEATTQSPSVFNVLPSSGPDTGGTHVTILGKGFRTPFTVRFGEDEAIVATLDSEKQISATSPAHPAETVVITVTTPEGTSAVTNRTRFNYLPPDDVWSPSGPLDQGREQHTATLLGDGTVLAVGGGRGVAERYDPEGTDTVDALPVKGRWREAGEIEPRVGHSSTRLEAGSLNGHVLVVGGGDPTSNGPPARPTRIYNPTATTWSTGPEPLVPRYQHSATVLEDGRVLVAGGRRGVIAQPGNVQDREVLTASEMYDPGTGLWTATGPLSTARAGHTATRLDGPACKSIPRPGYCGKVLVAGGTGGDTSSELFDPVTGLWAPAGAVATPRINGTATVLPSGRVLLAGGSSGVISNPLVIVELYDPTASITVQGARVQGAWSVTSSMIQPRSGPAAVLLQGPSCGRNCGKVLVAGGNGGQYGPTLNSAELYNPETGRWEPTSALRDARKDHTVTALRDGTVLAVGGRREATATVSSVSHRSSELFGPGPPLPTPSVVAVSPRGGPTSGQTRVAITGSNLLRASAVHFGEAPARIVKLTDSLIVALSPPQPQGTVDVRVTTKGGTSLPLAGARFTYAAGSWQPTAALATARYQHGATLLDGRRCQVAPAPTWCGLVLVFGGARSFFDNDGGLGTSELYDPAQRTWRSTGSLAQPRFDFASVTLPDGRVLVTGGRQGDLEAPPVPTSELFDPATESWTPAGSLRTPRLSHTATMLADGRVLVVGGTRSEAGRDSALASAELFDPASGTWRPTGALTTARTNHSTTLLADGRVLVAGGLAGGSRGDARALASAEVFDPATETWTATAPPAVARFSHSATLLDQQPCGARCGQVLLAGGISSASGSPIFVTSAELFDPVTGSWSPTGSLGAGRGGHMASTLPDGSVLVAGSGMTFPASAGFPTASAELYRPTTGEWSYTSFMTVARGLATTTLLDGPACRGVSPPAYCGSVLTAGGGDVGGVYAPPPLSAAELYVPAPRLSELVPARGAESGGTSVVIRGSGFAGASSVSFGDTAVSGFTVDSPTRITVPSPPHAPGPVNVTVVNDAGTSATMSAQPASRFVYVTAPGAVLDLVATPVSDSRIDLGFTAPDDGSGQGPATSYLVKQSEQPIDSQAAFDAATSLCGGRCNFPSGATVILSVADLQPGATYHYAVRAVNEEGLLGPISASASATTLPSASTTPCAKVPEAVSGQVAYRAGYSLVALPGTTRVSAQSPLYSWFDLGAGGSYAVQSGGEGVLEGRGYWAWFRCPSLVELAGPGATEVRSPLGAYHASMVGNPSASPATVTGHDFAARWDPAMNGGAGGYAISGYREPQSLAVGEGTWTFSYVPTEIRINAAG